MHRPESFKEVLIHFFDVDRSLKQLLSLNKHAQSCDFPEAKSTSASPVHLFIAQHNVTLTKEMRDADYNSCSKI